MSIFSSIARPTLLLDEVKARKNLLFMIEKANRLGVPFRPHFKTHQSAEIGTWFHENGVTAITVSSVEMAQYFAQAGWNDILIAFPVNLRQMEEITKLASEIRLSLLIETPEVAVKLDKFLSKQVEIWIKVDVGAGRTGIHWLDEKNLLHLVNLVLQSKHLKFKGLLTHSGNTYKAKNKQEIQTIYNQSLQRLLKLKQKIQAQQDMDVCISVGDTPSSVLVDDWGEIDEIRPGNFLFYDVQQFTLGVCREDEIAVCLAAPVVSIHCNRKEIIVYGGAVHLSKDSFFMETNNQAYGYICKPTENGWTELIQGAYIRSLSQEHGVIRYESNDFDNVAVGDILCILPAHSCLTVQAMRRYVTLDGEPIETMLSGFY